MDVQGVDPGDIQRLFKDCPNRFHQRFYIRSLCKLCYDVVLHFYTPFYVYQYATGISAAGALSTRILELGEEGVKDYMKFLTGGGSQDPIDLLKLAGVDMSEKAPVQAALKLFDEMVTELEEMLG